MKFFKCGKCDKILEDKYAINHPKSEITWYNATEHEDKEKEIDQLQQNNNEEDKEKKDESRKAKEHEKLVQAYRAELEDMDKDEVDDLLESLRAEIHELRKKLNPETDEDKQSRKASVEYLGYDSSLITKSKNAVKRYDVLLLEPYESVTHSGDRLLIKMGSTDSDSVSDTSGDELLRKLGSTD